MGKKHQNKSMPPVISAETPPNKDSEDSSEDELEEQITLQKKDKGFFTSGFSFAQTDSWEDVANKPIPGMKRLTKAEILDEKIEEFRNKRKSNQKKRSEGNTVEIESDEEMQIPLDKDVVRDKRTKPSQKPPDDRIEYESEALAPSDLKRFTELSLSRPLQRALVAMRVDTPTPIQAATIPVALAGRDVCACAATGTGKTLAFMLPVLERLLFRPHTTPTTRVLVLSPTRELAVQIFQVARQLAQNTNITVSLSAGGLDVKSQEAALRLGPDVVIATPGRLIDHLHNAPSFSLGNIEVLVLDEADRMLDEYFADQMKEVIRLCSKKRQTMLFSATMTEAVKDLAAVSLEKPVRVFVNENTDVAHKLRQEFVRIRPSREGDREAIVAALLSRTFKSRVMLFTQTKAQAHRMHIQLGLLGINAAELHGNLPQAQRLLNLQRFKDRDVDVLLATDVAARGLDIAGVATVINFTMPPTVKHYVHRVGRTARAGKGGRAVTLVGEKERALLKELVKKAHEPVKSRVLPPAVVESFRKRLVEMEADVKAVTIAEREESAARAAENQANKAEKLLDGNEAAKRVWFQSSKERRDVQAELRLNEHSGKRTKRRKGKDDEKKVLTPADRVEFEQMKSMMVSVRAAKKQQKERRIGAPASPPVKKRKNKKVKVKSFDKELTNTGQGNVRKMRAAVNEKKKFGKRKR